MTARTMLVVTGYAEMATAGLLGAVTLLHGPLVLGAWSRNFALRSTAFTGAADVSGNTVEAKLVELGFYGVVFALGLLLLMSAACARPEAPAHGHAPRRLPAQRPRGGAPERHLSTLASRLQRHHGSAW